MDTMSTKKRELARKIEQIENFMDRAKDAKINELVLHWMYKKEGLEDAFQIVFGQKYIDYWMEEIAHEYEY